MGGTPRRLRHRLLTRSLIAVLVIAGTAGCTRAIADQASTIGSAEITGAAGVMQDHGPGRPRPGPGVAPAVVAVSGDRHTRWDTQAKNTIADLHTYYVQIFPDAFHQKFVGAEGLESYDSADPTAQVCGRSLYRSVNAFHNPSCDTIVRDRGVVLPEMGKDVGDLGAPTILAHEMGHLVQHRLHAPVSSSTPVVLLEQQADCYAGAYWRWVADGHSTYCNLNQGDGMPQVLSAMMSTGDPVGSTASAEQAHGSGFDRSFAFSLGHANGAVRCSTISAAEVAARSRNSGNRHCRHSTGAPGRPAGAGRGGASTFPVG